MEVVETTTKGFMSVRVGSEKLIQFSVLLLLLFIIYLLLLLLLIIECGRRYIWLLLEHTYRRHIYLKGDVIFDSF
jgi:hypothetical protein